MLQLWCSKLTTPFSSIVIVLEMGTTTTANKGPLGKDSRCPRLKVEVADTKLMPGLPDWVSLKYLCDTFLQKGKM